MLILSWHNTAYNDLELQNEELQDVRDQMC